MSFALPPLADLSSAQQTASASTNSVGPQHRKLTDAAQQFEGMLLQELLKPMREHSFGSGDSDSGASDDPDSSGFADTLSSFGSETLATSISRSGGLGIAKLVIRQMEGKNGQSVEQHGTHANLVVTKP